MSSVGAQTRTATLLRRNVPKELQEREQWLPAKVVEGEKGQTKKVPFWKDGKFAEWKKDESQRMSFEKALSFVEAKGYDGVAYVPTDGEPIWFVDLDDHIQEGRSSTFALRVLQALNSYTEFSYSGEGYHVLGWGAAPQGGRKSRAQGLEIYPGLCKPIFFTGKRVRDFPAGLEERTEEITKLIKQAFGDRTPTEKGVRDVPVLPNSLSDEELVSKMTGRNAKWAEVWEGSWEAYYLDGEGKPDHSAADQGLANQLAFWTGNERERIDRLMRRSGLLQDTDRLTKWDKVHSSDGLTYGEMTIEKALKSSLDDVYKGSQGDPGITFEPAKSKELLSEDDRRLIDLLIARKDLSKLRLILTTMTKSKTLPYLRDVLKEAEVSLWGENAVKKRAAFFSHIRFSDTRLSDEIKADLMRWGYDLKLCILDDRVYVNEEPIDDITRSVVRVKARDDGYGGRRIPLTALDDVIKAVAAENVFHPIKDVLEAHEWDGEDHITKFCQYIKTREDGQNIVYGDGTEEPIKETFIRKWLIGAVARVYELTQNEVLVLASVRQELGKTRTAAWLASPFEDSFYEGEIDPGNKHHLRYLASKFIWDVSELDATTGKRDVSALKFFVTQTYTSFDVKYVTFEIKKPALASFIASVNGSNFLSDMTGNRRFRVLNVIEIDQSYRDTMEPAQIWAQAYSQYKAGESWLLTEEERTDRDRLNEEHTQEAPYIGLVRRYYSVLSPEEAECARVRGDTDWYVHTQDLVDVLKEAGVREVDRAIQRYISQTMTFLKFPKRKRDNLWGYFGLKRNETSTGITFGTRD